MLKSAMLAENPNKSQIIPKEGTTSSKQELINTILSIDFDNIQDIHSRNSIVYKTSLLSEEKVILAETLEEFNSLLTKKYQSEQERISGVTELNNTASFYDKLFNLIEIQESINGQWLSIDGEPTINGKPASQNLMNFYRYTVDFDNLPEAKKERIGFEHRTNLDSEVDQSIEFDPKPKSSRDDINEAYLTCLRQMGGGRISVSTYSDICE